MKRQTLRTTTERRLSPVDLSRIAVITALIAALGLPGAFPIFGPVPITAQTLGVMLAGAILGPLRSALAVSVLLGLTAVGAPLLAGGRGGLGVFLAPSAGYLLGWTGRRTSRTSPTDSPRQVPREHHRWPRPTRN